MSINYSDPKITVMSDSIQQDIANGKTKEAILNPFAEMDLGGIQKYLHYQKIQVGWDITVEEWTELVTKEFTDHEERKEFEIIKEGAIIVKRGEDNGLKSSESKRSAWKRYEARLRTQGFDKETIKSIHDDSEGLLRRLSLDTTETGAINGLVVGSVQSGKTTNMAALMSKAADSGWNVFIVLSGTIENLRVQTENRLNKDLSGSRGSVNWQVIERPSIGSSSVNMPQTLDFNNNAYLIVSLKQASRLEDLYAWLTSDMKQAKNMRILVIDDEADQASVNTADLEVSERTKINKLLVKLVHGETEPVSKINNSPFKAMNYVAYTATPYANVLSESEISSLYPSDFISLLQQSKNYIGPSQLFGSADEDYPGLDIIRTIDLENPTEFSEIDALHQGNTINLPLSLKRSISYFIAASASLRLNNFQKPLSMLVHTSIRTEYHERMAFGITSWVKKNKNEVKKLVEKVWNYETSRFTKDHFKESMPLYSHDTNSSYTQHTFSEIEEMVDNIISEITPIKSEKKNEYTYHNGIHISVDNNANNKVDENNSHYRLRYPIKEKDIQKSPIFIVVGGATLSRGLTLEGLVTTYFIRNSGQADSLMQMGRWFGYRVNYEVFPRIWLSNRAIDQFSYLADLDNSLRDEIKRSELSGKTPSEAAIRIKNSPKNTALKITSDNKKRGAIESDFDFTGALIQTTIFEDDANIMKENLESTINFIDDLGKPKILNSLDNRKIYWEQVKFEVVKKYLLNYKYSPRFRAGNSMPAFINWVEEISKDGGLDDWNVIAVGRGSINEPGNNWIQKHFSWNKVERTKVKNAKVGDIRIKSLRAPSDLYGDIDLSKVENLELQKLIKSKLTKNYLSVRERLGLERTPQLMLYIIDKDSKPSKQSHIREPLDTPYDIAGIHISIPGGQEHRNYVTHFSVELEKEMLEIEDNDIDMEEDDVKY